MFASVKNAGAALIFALSGECSGQIELDESGEQEAERLMNVLREAGCKIEPDEVEYWRRNAAMNQRSRELIADSAVSIDEIVRWESECEWRNHVCSSRKSIRTKFYSLLLLATLPLVLKSWGAPGLSGLALLFFIGWLSVLIVELDIARPDAEKDEVRRESLAARRAGDSQKSIEIYLRHHDRTMSKIGRTRGEQIELLIQQANDEPRN